MKKNIYLFRTDPHRISDIDIEILEVDDGAPEINIIDLSKERIQEIRESRKERAVLTICIVISIIVFILLVGFLNLRDYGEFRIW